MKRETEARIVRELLDIAKSGQPSMGPAAFQIPVERYTSAARFEQERDSPTPSW